MNNFVIKSIKTVTEKHQKEIVDEIQKVSDNSLYQKDSSYFYENELTTNAIKNLVLNFEVQTYDSGDDIIIQCPKRVGEPFYFKHLYELEDYPSTYEENNNHVYLNYDEGIFIISALFMNPYKEIITLNGMPDPVKVYLRSQEKMESYITITR